MAEYEFDRSRIENALSRFERAPEGPIALEGPDFVHGSMGAMFNAERLAAAAGLVQTVKLADGTEAIVNIGQARDVIDRAPPDVRTLYLATHSVVRQTHAQAQRAPAGAELLGGLSSDDGELGLAQLAIVVIVIGVAAILATAGYFVSREIIQVGGRNLRTIAELDRLNALAETQLRTTGKIDPELMKALAGAGVAQDQVEAEAKASAFPIGMAIGAGALGLAGAGFYAHKRGWLRRFGL